MRTYAQLDNDEQARAVQYQLDRLMVDPALAADPAVNAVLTKLARQRARDAYYPSPGDQLVTLPPPPPATV